jgi:hypothetical protein
MGDGRKVKGKGNHLTNIIFRLRSRTTFRLCSKNHLSTGLEVRYLQLEIGGRKEKGRFAPFFLSSTFAQSNPVLEHGREAVTRHPSSVIRHPSPVLRPPSPSLLLSLNCVYVANKFTGFEKTYSKRSYCLKLVFWLPVYH